MDDEVFVTVHYTDEDFVRVRRLMLLDRLRQANTGQLVMFVGIGAIGALFLAPEPIGRIFASAAGALIGLVGLLIAMGWLRAATPIKLPIEHAALEISRVGVVLKTEARFHRARWRDFDAVSSGLGIFSWVGKHHAVILPARCLRADQEKTLRALVKVHAAEAGSP